MIDIGVNFTNSRFDKDRPAVIERAKQAAVSALLVTGTNVNESCKAIKLCQQFDPYLYCTAGVHPHDADQALIATELGVWSTDNIDGATTDWTPTSANLANTRVDMLKIRCASFYICITN